ncbi:hypothetical protein EDD37DRAFT_86198 [Exophiala viscosa]|uniref:uncharacterized protein n=1 Tax=Exophiala viscosa TaxID=2486360 RepID=UPI0021968649|nr:hypothetical protein EDD37DRAFT_86198 [Exophiala viscosa]
MSRENSPQSSERTPLLSNHDESDANHVDQPNEAASVSESLDAPQTKQRKRWPTAIALSILCVAVVLGCFGLALPSVIQEYAKEAVVLEPSNISIDSFTELGIRARLQGDVYLDAGRVKNKPTRDLGRFGTWIAREVQSGETEVNVYLPQYDNILLGTATIPPVKINIRNQHSNHMDILADIEPGDIDGARRIAKDFIDGKLKELAVEAVATVPVRSGLIKLGKQTVTQSLKFAGDTVPSVPKIDFQRLRIAEYGMPGHPEGVKAQAVVSAMNDFPLKFDLPPLSFDVLLPDCDDDYLLFGTTKTEVVHILPKQNITASVVGLVQQLPNSLTSACPGTKTSPLDSLIGDYLAGRNTTVYIRGGKQDSNTPEWIGNILRDTTLPFTLPGHPFDNLIKNFSMANVHFSLPDPNSDSRPRLSAVVQVLVGLPTEMNVNLDVDKVRADGDVFYEGELMGKLDLREWQASNATKIDNDLLIQSIVKDAPLEIADNGVFSKVVKQILWGKGARLSVHATVDVNSLTALGEFVVRNIPATGDIFIKPLSGAGDFKMPEVTGMEVVDTSETSLTLQATVNMTNPTDYSASIPFSNVSTWVNGTRVGWAWISDMNIVPGPNEILARASWEVGSIGREWLSQFISGYNTSLTIKTHAGTIPPLPDPGLEMTVPTPHMFGKFLRETTMHLFSSTATFLLFSPFAMYVTSIAATAYYNDTEIGTIDWDYPFAIEVGENVSPRLPVAWGSNAIGTIRDAIGGTLKLDAKADVGVRIGHWQENIWYEGYGLGAKIRL